jgi:hypothetical protein
MFLRGDIGLTGLSLGIKRVEALLKSLVCAFAGIDRTSHQTLSPKNFGPERRDPVISWAMRERDEYGFPSNSKPSPVTLTTWV